jgi:hypothetical protein
MKVAQNNADFTAKECQAVMKKYLSRKGNSAKQIYDEMSVTVGDKCPSFTTAKNCVSRFKQDI